MGRATDELQRLRHLLARGHSGEALRLADRLLASTEHDAGTVAQARLYQLAAMINLGRRAELTSALDAATDAVTAVPDPRRSGRLHSLAAIVAHLDDSLERCVRHLVASARALAAVDGSDEETACAWHDLAMAYSYVGFHGHALSAMEHSRKIALDAGLPGSDFITPTIRVRLAVWHDHNGDTDACLRVLRDVADEITWHERSTPGGLDRIQPLSLGGYGYAVARMAALGAPAPRPAQPLLDAAGPSMQARDLRLLGDVCLAIADGQAPVALDLLARSHVAATTMGAPEPYRLTALAHLAAGEYAEAYRADRRAHRATAGQNEQLRTLFVDGVAAWMDHEHMTRTVARYQGGALHDPLTGLPNRRYLERHVAELLAGGQSATLCMCDLDAFKQVNSTHGHLSGDLVLRRVAGVLARVVRRGDFVARYGSDEFVVVLPGTGRDGAAEIARRIVAAVAGEDWQSLVPGTPVGVTIGWSEVTGRVRIATAFEAADRAMLQAKTS